MIWLALMWLTLVALWGASEQWHVGRVLRRHGARLAQAWHHQDSARPFDWAE